MADLTHSPSVWRDGPSPRLDMVARMIGNVRSVADIGCDHCALPLALLKSGQVDVAICTDIQAPVVEHAVRRARAMGWTDRLEGRVGDGLSVLRPGEAEVIVMAGLGGKTISVMLAVGAGVTTSVRRLVFQPMRGAGALRKWLVDSGYVLVAEDLVEEGGRLYAALAAEPQRIADGVSRTPGNADASPTGSETLRQLAQRCEWPLDLPEEWLLEVGPLLWRDRHLLLPRWIESQADRLLGTTGVGLAVRRLRHEAGKRCAQGLRSRKSNGEAGGPTWRTSI